MRSRLAGCLAFLTTASYFLRRLDPVDLQTMWPDDARDFTPWLAREVNLRYLSNALNLELELDRIEADVAPFSANIAAVDASSNSKVVIESQLKKSGPPLKTITNASGWGEVIS
jgi:hypothetical protein